MKDMHSSHVGHAIHVTCAADAGYGPYAGIALSSVLSANRLSKVCVHLFSDGVKEKDIAGVRELGIRYGADVFVYDMREKLDSHPMLQDHAHYSRASYIRLFIPEFVPSDVD